MPTWISMGILGFNSSWHKVFTKAHDVVFSPTQRHVKDVHSTLILVRGKRFIELHTLSSKNNMSAGWARQIFIYAWCPTFVEIFKIWK